MIKLAKNCLAISLTILISFILLILVVNYLNDLKYWDKISMYITPSMEGCDEYNHLWKIKSVDDPDYKFLLGEPIYLVNRKLAYGSDTTIRLKVTGYLYRLTQNSDYLCADTYIFDDLEIKKMNQ
jgi:hypothetical protein